MFLLVCISHPYHFVIVVVVSWFVFVDTHYRNEFGYDLTLSYLTFFTHSPQALLRRDTHTTPRILSSFEDSHIL